MKNYIFDLYGTLADISTDESTPRFINKINRHFASDNFSDEYLNACKTFETGDGFCEIDLLKVFEKILNCPKEEALRAALYFRKKSRSGLKVYRGVRALLGELKQRGKKLYILSNAQACFTDAELDKLKIKKYFDGVELSSDFGRKKPCKAFFSHVLEKYVLDPAETVFVGNDIESDIRGAKSVGLETAYILSNLSPEGDSVEKAGQIADFATCGFEDLADYLLSL